MGVISESAVWEDSVLQIEVGDPVGGGPSAVVNLQAQDLANRTKWLKENKLDASNFGEFYPAGVTPTYVDATTFSVPDDLTGIFTEGRILKITDGAEVKYLSVVSSAFDTVTNVVIDGTITASITAVDYSLVQYGLPLASETVKGVVKVGSNISVADGVISVPEATEAVKGVVEVGANLSVDNGVISVPEATETVKGLVELATSAEVLAGVDNERAVTPAGFKAALVSPSMTGSATLNGTTDNTVQLTDIVTTLGLEVGDVIRIQYTGYNKLHTVESITDNSNIIVNYEHAGNRGNGSLKLPNTTASVTVTRISKWYNAPLGLGQGWVGLIANRAAETTYTNTTGKEIAISATVAQEGAWVRIEVRVDGIGVSSNTGYSNSGSNHTANAFAIIPAGSTYTISGVIGNLASVSELR
jgi:hypothetical protein